MISDTRSFKCMCLSSMTVHMPLACPCVSFSVCLENGKSIYIEREKEIDRKEERKIDGKIEVEAYLGDLGRGGANQILVLQLRPPGDTRRQQCGTG